MKKTIALLLAAAGMAMGATPMDVTWENNAATLSGEQTKITAVFTLDLTALKSNGAIFAFTPTSGDTQYGIMNKSDAYGPYLYDVTPGLNEAKMLSFSPFPDEYSAIIAYTYDKAMGATVQLTTYDSMGKFSWSGSYKRESDALDFTSISTLLKSSAIGKIDIYNTVLEGDDIAAAIDYLLNPNVQPDTPGGSDSPTVPEPTTATLSLLALAGLAARRRRR
ncbi:MAG: PEP-CTERM sorting domain-containing protein [Akkermansia sp.]|nr:PEP-CTERM sorting domain-containing protein [Akkermansia sp.]